MEEQNTPAAAPKQAIKVNKLVYHGKMGALYGVWLKNVFLTVLTLGVYHFWGKTNLRRYLVGALELDGDRLEYLGTGKELFLGFLKILPFYIAFGALFNAPNFNPDLRHSIAFFALMNITIFVLVFYLVPVAVYSGFRYRINRLSWRGVRGLMRGSAFAYGAKYFGGSLLALVTLGIMSPKIDLGRWEYQVQHMQFGTVPFAFRGDPKNLSKVNIVTLLLFIPTLGLSRLWYRAALEREKLRGLTLGNIRFRWSAKAGNYLGLAFGNIFIMILTLYIGLPFIYRRNVRFYERFLAVGGDLKTFTAQQAARGKAGDAEGGLDFIDVDLGMIGA